MKTLVLILPVYNGGLYLNEAIFSILNQSFGDFQLIIINDGSKDNSEKVIKNFNDHRIHYVYQQNQGLAATLNMGIKLSDAKYIGRLDQDDLMNQYRLAKQIEYLELHPDCAMVGTWSEIWVGNNPTNRGHQHPSDDKTLRLELLFDNPFVHSSMMIRADVLHELGGYSVDKTRQPPEDYELWSRIARKYQVANIPEVLTVYREVEGSMSRTGDNPFLANVIKISAENISAILSPKFDFEHCYSLAALYHGKMSTDSKKLLPKSRALFMHKAAALIIAGDTSMWSEEFVASYRRQQLQIRSQFVRRFLPNYLLKPARFFKNFLKRTSAYVMRIS